MNPAQLHADSIAVKGDRILKVGSNAEINQLIGKKTHIIRLNGKTVVPGFIDTHVHIADFAALLTWMELTPARSVKDVQTLLKNHLAKLPKGKWVLGRGWDKEHLAEKRNLTCFDLDAVAPDNPVILYHRCELMCVVNSKALELAGVTKQTAAPPDGTIERDPATGEITGILQGTATNLVWTHVPEPTAEELLGAVGAAFEKFVQAGVTSIHWLVRVKQELAIIRTLRGKDKPPIRVNIVVPAELLDEAADFKSEDSLTLRLGGAEITVDGYLASRTAALAEPYSDGSLEKGQLLCTQEEMNRLAQKTHRAGLQLVVHAVGDLAVDMALKTIEGAGAGFRSRIEQAAVLNPNLLERIKAQKVVVSVQPLVIATEFEVWQAKEHLGDDRAKWFFPLKTLLNNGIHIAGGSDCPMEPLNPLLGVQKAATRTAFPEQCLSVEEALCMYTADAAYCGCEEGVKGTIEAGKLADLVVLSNNPLITAPNRLSEISAEICIVGGKVAFSKTP